MVEPTGPGRRGGNCERVTARCSRMTRRSVNGCRGSRRGRSHCAKRWHSRRPRQRLVEVERLESRDLLAVDAVSLPGQLSDGPADVAGEADRCDAEVAFVSLVTVSPVVGENVVDETETRTCRWPGFRSHRARLNPLSMVLPLAATDPAALDGVLHQPCDTAGIEAPWQMESRWSHCADPDRAVANVDVSLAELSRVEPISLASWFAPHLPALFPPLAPVSPEDWTTVFSQCCADLEVWEIPDGLLLQASFADNFEQFASCDLRTASEFVEIFLQQAEQVVAQSDVADWLTGDGIPSWLEAGALAGGAAVIGTTVWYGYPEWENPTVASALATDCAESLAGYRLELPTIFDGGQATSLRWRLRGEYWPFGPSGITCQDDSAAIGFSGRAWYLSERQDVQWTGNIALGFDQTGIQAGYFDLSGSFIENPLRIDLVVAGSYGDGPGLADGAGQFSVGLSGGGPVPLTVGTRLDRLHFAVRMGYDCAGSQHDHRSEFTVSGSFRAEY